MSSYSEMPNDAVLYSLDNHVAHILLNRPDRFNSVDHDLTTGLLQGLDNALFDPEVRAVVLSGAGPGFSAGADLKGFTTQTAKEIVQYIPMYYGSIVKKIITMDKPVIAAIHGSVAGVSLAFALACDLRVMSESAVLRFPFINIGLGPDGGAGWLLTRAVGYSRAFEIVVGGEKISAQRCYELGLANKLVSSDETLSTALEWAHVLAQKAPIAMMISKRDLRHASTHTLSENTLFEAEQQYAGLTSRDFTEGVQAFLEKRKPNFTGQ
jgi:2-(1,2-epoxy-1,2-dihydrophenyl)acetyl-CoA isomerase